MTAFVIAVAGAAGALARYGVGVAFASRGRELFPWATFIVNVTGSFVIGVLFAGLSDRTPGGQLLRIALTVGFLGAYTTFSAFSLETFRLIETGRLGLAALNGGASVAAGLTACAAGIAVGRAVAG